jgi:cohesin complex subunit SA-1/2
MSNKRKRTVSLAIRPATKTKKPRTIRKSAITDVLANGAAGADDSDNAPSLYAQIFGDNSASLQDVAAKWVESFKEHEASAVAEIVNFVLRAAGCSTGRIDGDDIADPDHCPNRLGEIQEVYQSVCLFLFCFLAFFFSAGRIAGRGRGKEYGVCEGDVEVRS